MRRLIVLALAALLAAFPALAKPVPARLTHEQAVRELNLLERAFTELHPGLYRYQTEADLKAAFARARAEVAEGADAATMYLLATRLAASVRCGHTFTNPLNQRHDIQAMLAALPALPFRVRLLQERLLVTASADPAVRANDEILSIDGRSIRGLIGELMPYLRADGSNDGKRLDEINTVDEGGALDSLLPLLHPPVDGRYMLRVRAADGVMRTASVAGLAVSEREARLAGAGTAAASSDWHFEIDGDVARLTLPTFSFWRSDFDWAGYLKQRFQTMDKQHVARLVIDLRQNEGGDSAIGQALLGYLIDAPYEVPPGRLQSAYERVPYDLARYLDTWDFSFFDRTGQVVRQDAHRWGPKEAPAPEQVLPSQPRFRGKVVALVGPRMSSAGFLLARDLKATGAAVLVGETTGGNRRGLNGGQLAWLTLPYSGVAVDIPLIATVHDGEPDAGIDPDVEIRTSVEDVLAGRDPVRDAALLQLQVP